MDIVSTLQDRIARSLLNFTGSQRFLSVQFDITNACNLRCLHCYHENHDNRGALDLPGWRAILDQYGRLAAKLHLEPNFVLCGGEPTISPLFLPMVEEIKSRWPDVRITVLTNATRLFPDFIARLKGSNVGFQISLDGPDELRHDLIRGAGNFKRALAGLENLQSTGLNASFLATLSRRTSPWIAEFFATASRARAERMSFTRFVSQGSGRRLEERREDGPLAGSALRAAMLEILRASRTSGVPTNTNTPLYRLLDPSLGANGKFGFQGLVIDYTGNLKVTSRADYKLGSVLEHGLENLFLKHPLMQALRERRIAGCGDCAHYDGCGGDRNAAFAATGSFLTIDPGCWLDEPARTVSQEVQ